MICEKSKCCGCFACYNICPNNSIIKTYDEIGHIYMDINRANCIKCEKCKKVCPVNNKKDKKYPLKCYAGWSKNVKERITSTSGGIASSLSNYIIKNKGIVYGAAYDKSLGVNHIRINNIKDVYKLKGTKYVHSWINNSYKQAREDLENGKTVLFIGTPCQISGLKNYLPHKFDNLFTIDIVCHGVPPQQLFKEHIENIVCNIKNCKISFRDNDGYRLKIFKDDILIYNKQMMQDNYFRGFITSLYNRYSCNECMFCNEMRVSDLTIGDFWGLGELEEFKYDSKNGVSLILINTETGNKLIERCKNNIFLQERKIEEAFLKNAPLNGSITAHKRYMYFRKKYIHYGLEKSVKLCFIREDKINNIKGVVKKILKK